MRSKFGAFLDPLADKILVAAAFFVLCKKSIIPDWFAIIIVTREFAVTGLRQIAASNNIIIQADKFGKIHIHKKSLGFAKDSQEIDISGLPLPSFEINSMIELKVQELYAICTTDTIIFYELQTGNFKV